MKKYIWLLALIVLVIPVLLAACGGKTSTTPATTPTVQPITKPTQTTTPAPTTAPPVTTPATTTPPKTTPTPTVTQTGGIPAIPHTLDGRSDCLLCHKTGIAGAPAVPASHAGRTSDICQTCHKPA